MSHKVPFHSNFVEQYSDACVSLQEDGMTINGFKTFVTPSRRSLIANLIFIKDEEFWP